MPGSIPTCSASSSSSNYALFIPCDFARHFAEYPPPKVGYEESSFAEVHEGIGLARAYLLSVSPARMDELAGLVVPTFFDESLGLAAESYAAHMIMPGKSVAPG